MNYHYEKSVKELQMKKSIVTDKDLLVPNTRVVIY